MDANTEISSLTSGVAVAMARAGMPPPSGLARLTGGATMESWRFTAGEHDYVLRRAPSDEVMRDRPFGHAAEAALIRAARAGGVMAPELVAELRADDGIGSGFIMRAIPGTADPRVILAEDGNAALLSDCARELAAIHALDVAGLPDAVPVMDYAEALAGLRGQFDAAGGDRPIIALALRWLADNLPDPVPPVLVHGDYRTGNLLVEDGRLTGVLDWELAHLGDPHEDLAYACMTVWRFARIENEALGLGSLEAWFAAYRAAGGGEIDPVRFRFWLIYRTCWWALGCLSMGETWRSGADRTLERAVISRRTSEQELDLLLLLEEDAPAEARERGCSLIETGDNPGEAMNGELAQAVLEWLETIKPLMTGHDRFQHAVARNALKMIVRDEVYWTSALDYELAQDLLSGRESLRNLILLNDLRQHAIEKLSADVPSYPALAVAKERWIIPDED